MTEVTDSVRERYQQGMLAIRHEFEGVGDGRKTVQARAALVDSMVEELWVKACQGHGAAAKGVAMVATGGYGRRELFPASDIDLLFLVKDAASEKKSKALVREICQGLWDCGMRVSPATRTVAECDKVDANNVEGVMALVDRRVLAGDAELFARLDGEVLPKLLQRESRQLIAKLVELTQARHLKYGRTLFHLEPNIKDCPGGLRDSHVCGWMETLQAAGAAKQKGDVGKVPDGERREFEEDLNFLFAVRCFLHYRKERDDNTLDWQAQDAASQAHVGVKKKGKLNASQWMRVYFRRARGVERCVLQALDGVTVAGGKLGGLRGRLRGAAAAVTVGYSAAQGVISLDEPKDGVDVATDPDVVLEMFGALAVEGMRLERSSQVRIEAALPLLSVNLEEGPALWNRLKKILGGRHAGTALRMMHALGLLELLIPEFHGIDALVMRDAYHRYTVDEHTFVVIDTLHGLGTDVDGQLAQWSARFATILREVQHPELLYLAALMHDTGKGRSSANHAAESAKMTRSLLGRLELDSYESSLVIALIENHLEMSAALRRDIFDAETVRVFAEKVETPEALRMLMVFTYADIAAVHPDALTPWKAENLWRLNIATSNYMDRNVDDDRVDSRTDSELLKHVTSLVPGKVEAVRAFLAGFPQRYLKTRSPEQIARHFELATHVNDDEVQLDFHHGLPVSEITLVSPDRAMLFATMAGSLAAWGMNIVTGDAFSNAQGIVVDSFRFTDTFRTLELNPSERDRFVRAVHDAMAGLTAIEAMPVGRRRGKRRAPLVSVETNVRFENEVSSHSTLLQVVAQDVPGLLRAVSFTLGKLGCNVEVALIDTEGETAIDVFYLTKEGRKLVKEEMVEIEAGLHSAIAEMTR